MKCKRVIAWVGQCTNKAVDGQDFCEKHLEDKCCICGGQALIECGHTMGLVCGSPLCGSEDCFQKHGHLDG